VKFQGVMGMFVVCHIQHMPTFQWSRAMISHNYYLNACILYNALTRAPKFPVPEYNS
jgi:hypothetical protein